MPDEMRYDIYFIEGVFERFWMCDYLRDCLMTAMTLQFLWRWRRIGHPRRPVAKMADMYFIKLCQDFHKIFIVWDRGWVRFELIFVSFSGVMVGIRFVCLYPRFRYAWRELEDLNNWFICNTQNSSNLCWICFSSTPYIIFLNKVLIYYRLVKSVCVHVAPCYNSSCIPLTLVISLMVTDYRHIFMQTTGSWCSVYVDKTEIFLLKDLSSALTRSMPGRLQTAWS